MKPVFIELTRQSDGSVIEINPAQICWMRTAIERFYDRTCTWLSTSDSHEPQLVLESKQEIKKRIDAAYQS